MKCLTHSMDASASAPVGIWWTDQQGRVSSYYLPKSDAEEMLAKQIMWLRLETCKPEDYFDYLDAWAPHLHDWNVVEVNGEPEEFLTLLQGLRKTAA